MKNVLKNIYQLYV